MDNSRQLQSLSDEELLSGLRTLLQQSRRVEADLVAHIGEVDARRLYAREATSSMFAYCTQRLHLSEDQAYRRIEVARAARKHPVLLTMLRDGRLHLSGIALLARHLTPANRDALLKRSTHQSKRRIEELIAELAPQPDVPSVMRKLPERRDPPSGAVGVGSGVAIASIAVPASREAHEIAGRAQVVPGRVTIGNAALGSPSGPSVRPAPPALSQRAIVEPLAPARYKIQFTASAELHDKLEHLRSLMRSSVPDGDLAQIIDAAVTEKLERLEARRFAKTSRPRKGVAEADVTPSSRHIPAPIRRAVHKRDGGRCRYVDAEGRRCEATIHLQFHHRYPFGLGGDHSPDNVCLLCPAHNGLVAEVDYGKPVMSARRGAKAGLPAAGP